MVNFSTNASSAYAHRDDGSGTRTAKLMSPTLTHGAEHRKMHAHHCLLSRSWAARTAQEGEVERKDRQ